MNRDDIIRMAQEVGLTDWETLAYGNQLEWFAALVYAEAHKDGLDDFETVVLPAAIKAEREACAQVLESISNAPDMQAYAFAIRERGAQ